MAAWSTRASRLPSPSSLLSAPRKHYPTASLVCQEVFSLQTAAMEPLTWTTFQDGQWVGGAKNIVFVPTTSPRDISHG